MPKHWYVFIVVAIFALIVHGFILDPLIGFPPWLDNESSPILENTSLFIRATSWFTGGVTTIGAIFGGLTLKKYYENKTSNKVNPHGKI